MYIITLSEYKRGSNLLLSNHCDNYLYTIVNNSFNNFETFPYLGLALFLQNGFTTFITETKTHENKNKISNDYQV